MTEKEIEHERVPVVMPQIIWRLQVKLDPSAFVADPQLILALNAKSIAISCGVDRVLFQEGDNPSGLYILNKGEVTFSMTSAAGEELNSFEVAPRSLLGLPALVGNQPYTLTAVAHTGAQLNFITRDDFNSLMRDDPSLSLKILQVLAAEVRSARIALRDM